MSNRLGHGGHSKAKGQCDLDMISGVTGPTSHEDQDGSADQLGHQGLDQVHPVAQVVQTDVGQVIAHLDVDLDF